MRLFDFILDMLLLAATGLVIGWKLMEYLMTP
jgi:hypothetical protein